MACDGCERMAKVEQAINGNGGKGIAKKVEDHESLYLEVKGMTKMLKFLWPVLAAGAAAQVFAFFERLF